MERTGIGARSSVRILGFEEVDGSEREGFIRTTAKES